MKGRAGIAEVYGLILHAIENREEEYQRVGMFEHAFEFGKEWSVFDGIEDETEVKIV